MIFSILMYLVLYLLIGSFLELLWLDDIEGDFKEITIIIFFPFFILLFFYQEFKKLIK